MEKADLETPSCRTVQGDFTFHSGIEAARLLLSLKDEERPTAIFSSNDDMAAAVYLVAGQMGISVPKDLSVCGFDDTPLAQTIYPPLTTVRQPIYKMGYEAVHQLARKPDDLKDAANILDFEIKVRDSVAPPEGS